MELEDSTEIVPFPPTRSEDLPYVVELWNLPRLSPEQVLARAANVMVANALYAAACSAYVGRRVVLTRGEAVLKQSA